MPRFKIKGRDARTGKKRTSYRSAWTSAQAIDDAKIYGLIAEEVTQLPQKPATDAQKQYASGLGIAFPADIDIEQISVLISEATGDKHATPASDDLMFRAWREGFEFPNYVSQGDLEHLIASWRALQPIAEQFGVTPTPPITREVLSRTTDMCRAVRWVYSVCRHLAKADWVLFSDSGIDPAAIRKVASRVVEDPELMEQVWEQFEGSDVDYDRAADARGIDCDNTPTPWFFFNRDGANSRIRAFKAVSERIEVRHED